ncbi:MAG: outer membrane protein [Aestuariivirga sp.]
MKHHLFRLVLAATALVPVSSAFAADLDPPPPPAVEELRPATYDWSGPYVGAYGSLMFLHGRYGFTPDCVPPAVCAPVDPEMSGDGFAGGGVAGWNFDMGGMVLGMEGDFGWGGKVGENRDLAERTELSFDHIATIRARAGMAFDDTLVYVTGGAAFANAAFGGEVGPPPPGVSASDEDNKWIVGWTAGAGMEHAFADGLTGRIEYLYMDFPDTDFRLEDPNGFGGDIEMDFEGVHQVRAAVTYNFGW